MKSVVFILAFISMISGFAQEPNAAHYVTRPLRPAADATPIAAVPATIPLWTGTSDGFTYTMVGQSPVTALANPTTSIVTPVVPLILTFSDGTVFDPTAPDSVCSAQGTPLSLMLQSPLFNNFNYIPGGTSVGNTQYHDFFQRANFWTYTKPGGVNPNYHLLLNVSSGTPIKISVPATDGKVVAAKCGKQGEVDINWLDSYLETTGFRQLASNGVTASSMPVFMLYNVAMYDTVASTCCILGYHSAIHNSNLSNAVQTYAVGDFDTTGNYGSTHDVSSFSHEIGELIDDPLGDNPTPPWGNIGEITGCSSILEAGDPLAGTNVSVTMSNTYTYHVQELAFVSWFYDQSPSIAVNGWYSSNGTFTAFAKSCSNTLTTLSITPSTLAAGASAAVKITVKPSHGTGTPTGTVTLDSDSTGNTLATYTLSAGAIDATITTLPTGSYGVTAKYAGDGTYSPSISAPVLVKVGTAALSFTPIALNFGSQTLQTSSAAQSVTVKNIGTAALASTAISLTGASPGDFNETNTCGSSLAVNATCSVAVTFHPTALGPRTASISVGGQTVPLTGTGVAATVTLSFGNAVVGSSSASQTVTVSNPGTRVVLRVTGQDPQDFSATDTCKGSTCTVTVIFTPKAVGARTASLTVSGATAVTLTGTGIVSPNAAVTLSATSLSFSQPASQTVTVTNSGTGLLNILSITVAGVDERDFFAATTCKSQLAAAAKCTVTVTFRPLAAGSLTATLSIADSAVGSPQTVALSGTGTASTSTGPHGHTEPRP